MHYKVSIIVPIYGVEQYIERCARSLFEQTYDNIEYVFVNDSTPDRSVEVLKKVIDEYPERKGNIKIINHEKNRGLSASRNTGLKNCKGDYVYFVDSDDYIHCKTIECLLQASIKENAGIVVGDFIDTNSSFEDTHCFFENKEIQSVPIEMAIFEMLAFVVMKWCTAWNKLYKRSLIEGVFFDEEAYSIEDQDFNIKVYQKLENLVYVPQCFYYYYQNPNSIIRNPSSTAKRFYLNTKYRFKMLEHILLGKNNDKYRAWILDYGFRQTIERRDIVKGSEYEEPFKLMVNDLWKKNRKEYLINNNIPIKKKFSFMFYWFLPRMSGCYLRIKKSEKC